MLTCLVRVVVVAKLDFQKILLRGPYILLRGLKL